MTKRDYKYLLSLSIVGLLAFTIAYIIKDVEQPEPEIIIQYIEKIEQLKKDTVEVRITGYHANIKECGNNRRITYDGSKIPDTTVYWCAVSQDLLYYRFNFGDTITVLSKSVNHKYVIHDKTANRLKNTIDILLPDSVIGYCEKGIAIN